MAGTLAPAIAVMRDAMAVSREASRRNLLANYAVQGLEYYTAITMQTWTTGTTTMSGALDGHPNIQAIITRSDSPASGGLVGRLMHVQVTVFDDADGDAALDAGELRVTMRTKTSKLTTYQNVAN